MLLAGDDDSTRQPLLGLWVADNPLIWYFVVSIGRWFVRPLLFVEGPNGPVPRQKELLGELAILDRCRSGVGLGWQEAIHVFLQLRRVVFKRCNTLISCKERLC